MSDWLITDVEAGGDDAKFWLHGQAGVTSETSWLFKEATVKRVRTKQGGSRLYVRGEDWVEKICAELASLVGMPAARVELATRNGMSGLVSRDTRPDGWALHGGGVFVSALDARYQGKSDSQRGRNRLGHNLANVRTILNSVAPPPGWVDVGASGFDTFCGFLVFDAWTANRDRHEYNWAVLEDEVGGLRLSPSFDHGAALGSGLEEPRMAKLLDTDGRLAAWCEAGTAHRFEDCGEVSLIDFAGRALELASPNALAILENVCDLTRPGRLSASLRLTRSTSQTNSSLSLRSV